MLSLLLFCAFEGVAVFSLFFAAVGHSPINACVVDFCAGITNSGFSSALNMIAAGDVYKRQEVLHELSAVAHYEHLTRHATISRFFPVL